MWSAFCKGGGRSLSFGHEQPANGFARPSRGSDGDRGGGKRRMVGDLSPPLRRASRLKIFELLRVTARNVVSP
jgi:hypothetical protein